MKAINFVKVSSCFHVFLFSEIVRKRIEHLVPIYRGCVQKIADFGSVLFEKIDFEVFTQLQVRIFGSE